MNLPIKYIKNITNGIKMKKNKTNVFLNVLNTILLIFFVFIGVIFFVVTLEDKKDKNDIEFYSLEENKKEKTMFKNELPKTLKKEIFTTQDTLEDDFKEKDPDLAYAEKLFESSVNSKFKTIFKKPFNYEEGSYCMLDVLMGSNIYKIQNCNSDNIFKREVQIALNEMKPFKRKTYNKINLKNKKVTMKIKID